MLALMTVSDGEGPTETVCSRTGGPRAGGGRGWLLVRRVSCDCSSCAASVHMSNIMLQGKSAGPPVAMLSRTQSGGTMAS